MTTTTTAVRARPALAWAARVVTTILIGLFVAAITVLVVLPKLTGGASMTVLTGSMEPDLPVGSVVLVRPIDPAKLKPGDVATYQQVGGSNLITHRIVSIDRATRPMTFVFRGDRNPVADPQPVPATNVRGKVWFDVPYLGSLRNRLGHGRPAIVLIGVICLGGFSLWQFAAVWRDRKRRQA